MNKQEYLEKRKELKNDFEAKLDKLDENYAADNNPYAVGDIIKDHIDTIKIESMFYVPSDTLATRIPYVVYIGVIINKDGKPNKRRKKSKIHQPNIIK